MDPFELLKADHKKVAALFDQLEAAAGKAKLEIFNQIKQELEVHTHIEETIFYPALEKPRETHDITLEAYEEHDVVKKLLAELAKDKSANDEWQAKAKVLRENVEHHVEEEEGEMFGKADDVLSDEEQEALGNKMEMEKARKQGRAVKKPATGGKAKSKGVLSRIANFVGLGSDSSTRKATKKKRAVKASKKATTSKKTASGKSAPKAAAAKRSSTSQASKRSSTSKKSTKSSGTAKKGTKKVARKK